MVNDIHTLLCLANCIIENSKTALLEYLRDDSIPLIIRADILNESGCLGKTAIEIPTYLIPKELQSKNAFDIQDVIELISKDIDCYNLLEYMVFYSYRIVNNE